MIIENTNVISGPRDEILIPEESMGKYFLECMKKRDPNHVNMVDFLTDKTLTNGQILQSSIKSAKILIDLGIKKGDVIGIVVENTLNYCLPQLGALYIGATVHLLNPLYSIGEIKHALSISKPKVIICSDLSLKNVMQAHEELRPVDTKILLLENATGNHTGVTTFVDLIEVVPYIDPDSFEPTVVNISEDGAFILMSSGTTGMPKGVHLTHENIRAMLNYTQHKEYFGVSDKDTTIFVLPFFHVFGVVVQLVSVTIGMKLVMLNKFKPDVFLDSIEKSKPTKLYAVPPILLFLGKSPLVDNYDVSSIKDIIVGGAPVGNKMQITIMERMKGVVVRQIYGLTETTAACTFQTFTKTKFGSVGILVPHIDAKVWDLETKQNLGPREVGELCFKGPVVMKRYFGNRRVTQECIDVDGFFHSGDIGYYDEDGNIYVVDRVKELIKYKGFQVPPAELEALILTHPSVKDCGVIGIPDERAGQVPLAYVVLQTDVSISERDVVDYVAERISPQKRLYGGVKFIDEIPKTPSGKILRRKLSEKFHTSL